MEENKILYTVYYDPKLAHEFTGPSAPGMALPPLNFRNAAQNSKRSTSSGGVPSSQRGPSITRDPGSFAVAAPAKTRAKRKLSYGEQLVTFPVEAPVGHKKGRMSGNHGEQHALSPWALPCGESSSSDLQEGHSMGSISSYTSISSSFMPSPGPLQVMQLGNRAESNLEPPIDPVLTNGSLAPGKAKTEAALAATTILAKAGVAPLEMLLMILDPTLVEFEEERDRFFAQESHVKIHALLTNLQTNARLKQNFNEIGRRASAGVPGIRQVGEGADVVPSA